MDLLVNSSVKINEEDNSNADEDDDEIMEYYADNEQD